jgi:hypothetical protein
MPKIEYRACAVWGDPPGQMEETLNSNLKRLGEEGWRFVETIYGHNSLPLLLFKKRTKRNVKCGDEKAPDVPQGKVSKQK